jgi:hypothetical protein
MVKGVNSITIYVIYYKIFCKCLNVPPPSTIKKEKIKKKIKDKVKNNNFHDIDIQEK